MKRILILLVLFSSFASAQEMNNQKLGEIIAKHADTLIGNSGNWKFIYKEIPIFCITDENNNRMRILAPITESANLDKDLLLDSMTANFHSALDVRYAISQEILWSAYIHPLKELTVEQVESAISQVYLAATTFGTTFSSTALLFGADSLDKKTNQTDKEKDTNTQKF